MQNDENTPDLELDENQNQEEETQDESSDQEQETDWKAEALKQKAINKRISEKFNKPEVKSEPKGEVSVSQKDIYALAQSNVHIDDYDDVVDYAKFKNISVQEALKTDVIKTTLATKSEFRKTAEVSNTGATRGSKAKVSDDVLAKNLLDGKVPEKGSEEAERLFWARRGGKR